MKGIYTLLSGLLILLAGCTKDEGGERAESLLDRAERLAATDPESALTVLDAMDPGALAHPRTAARHALLRTKAQYDSGAAIGSDSTIRIAWRYYGGREAERENQCRTLYYWGCVLLRNDDEAGALKRFLQAEEMLVQAEQPCYLGKLYMRIGEVCYGEMDYSLAYNYFQRARGAFLLAKEMREKSRATFQMAAAAWQMRQMQQSIRLYMESLALADELHDEKLAAASLQYLALLYVITDRPAPAELMRRFEAGAETDDFLRADIELLHGRPAGARQWLARAAERSGDSEGQAAYHFTGMWAEGLAGNAPAAMAHLQEWLRVTVPPAQGTVRETAGEIEHAWFRGELRDVRSRMRVHKVWLAVVCCAAAAFAAGLWCIFRQRLHLHRLRNESYMRSAQEAQSAYKELYRQLEGRQPQAPEGGGAAAPRNLAASRFGVIDRLGRTYYEREHTSSQKEAIFQEVHRLITEVSTDFEIQRELEEIVDTTCDGAMRKLRENYPAMKESDRRLLCYVFSGFSPQVISLFMHETIDNIYARKSRLKSRIKAAEAPDKELFLSLFR